MNLPQVEPDAPASNVTGQTTSITLFTTQRPWGRFVMPALFAASRAQPKALAAMDSLSFISFASWSLVRDSSSALTTHSPGFACFGTRNFMRVIKRQRF